MSTPFTHLSLRDVEDVAPRFGFGDRWEARAAREPLGMERTGAMLLTLPAGGRSPFTHRHATPRRSTSCSAGPAGRSSTGSSSS